MRNLILVLGDQLDLGGPALSAGDAACDQVLMIETLGEARHVWSHRQRVVLFIAAMRHFRDALVQAGWQVHYRVLADGVPDLATGLGQALDELRPAAVRVTEPGEWRVARLVGTTCAKRAVPLEVLPDTHFYCATREFAARARGRRRLLMEHFYRDMRRRHGVLLEAGGPAGGRWNFDAENRRGFGRDGPDAGPPPLRFPPDATTARVITEVRRLLPDYPGNPDDFAWPVTRAQALEALADFITHRLPRFGPHQDGMWTGQPFLDHSLLSPALNLKLLNPREVVAAAEDAWRAGKVPLPSAEGFIRQILGWREYVRGIYWLHMPGYATGNHWQHDRPLPAWFWTGDVDLRCLHQTLSGTLAHGYAHHIQRLMVIGNFSLLAGLAPAEVCAWFLAIYVDAVEWVELPNTLGMALNADGGLMATKPYVASGNYIRRMSNYCTGCRYRPDRRTGDDACPVTTLYWDFLGRHRATLAGNARMQPILRNLDRFGPGESAAISARAEELRQRYAPATDLPRPRG